MPDEPIKPEINQPFGSAQGKPTSPGQPPKRPSFHEPLKKGEQEVYIERLKKITQKIKRRITKPAPPVAQTEEDPEEAGEPEEETTDEGPENPEPAENEAGVTIKGSSKIMEGGFGTLEAESSNENDTEFDWQSSNPMVANVTGDEGKATAQVYGIEEGAATITATGNSSGASNTHQIKVAPKEKTEDDQNPEEPEEKAEEPENETGEVGENGETIEGAEAGEAAEGMEAAGEAAEAAETAEVAAEAAEVGELAAAAPILPYILIGLAILAGVVALIVLVLFVLSILKGAGRTAAQTPDYTNAADAGAAGKVLAASQTQDASLIAKAAGIATQAALQNINNSTNQNSAAAQKQINQLATNASSLNYSLPTKKSYVNQELNQNKSLIDGLTNSNNSTGLAAAKTQVDGLTTDYNQLLSLNQPILQINPFDLSMIKAGKVDKRIIAALAKLVDFSLSQTGDNKERWSEFKIGQIYQADPYDKSETPLTESDQEVSAHYFGEAVDITVVGKMKCQTQGFSGILGSLTGMQEKTQWLPCYVSYQGGSPQTAGLTSANNYASLTLPLALSGASQTLGQVNVNSARSFYDFFPALGQQTVMEEMGINQNNWDQNTIFSPEKVLAANFSSQTNIPTQAISGFLQTADTKSLDRGLVEAQLKLATGSLTGNSWNEIFQNTFQNYLKQTLGLSGTTITDFNSNQQLGQALLEKSLLSTSDADQTFKAITRSNTYYQNLWQLSTTELSAATQAQDLTNLENVIGSRFKQGVMQSSQATSQSHWLGLPSGNLSDSNYQIAAGRYVFAKALAIDPDQSFTSSDYFFKQAPYSTNAGFDLCASLGSGTTCPAYNMFKDYNGYFQAVGNALNNKKDTNLSLGGNLQGNLSQDLGTNQISLNGLAAVLNNTSERTKMDADLNATIQANLQNNLEIATELPGLFSENHMQNGDWAFALPLLGLNKVSREAVLPPNTLEQLFLPNVNPNDVFQQIAGYQSLEALGANPWDLDPSTLPTNWASDPQEFKSIAEIAWLKSEGLDISSLDANGKLQLGVTNFSDLAATLSGDAVMPGDTMPDSLAAFMGLSSNDLQNVLTDIKGNQNLAAAQTLLSQTTDKNLGLQAGATYAMLTGTNNLNSWLSQGWQNSVLTGLANQSASQALNLPTGTSVNLNQLINGLENNDAGQLTDFLSGVGEAELGSTFQIPASSIVTMFNAGGGYQTQISALQDLAIGHLAQNIVGNQTQLNQLVALYQNYFAGGGSDALNSFMGSTLGVPTSAASTFSQNNLESAFSVLGAAQIANQAKAVLGDKAINYVQTAQAFFGNPASGTTGDLATYQSNQAGAKQAALTAAQFSLSDAALISKDSSIPVGASQILTNGTTDQKNMLFVNYIANKADLNASVIQNAVLNGSFNLQNLNVESFAAGLPGVSNDATKIGQVTSTFQDLQAFAKTQNLSSFSSVTSGFLAQQTGIPVAAYQQWNNALSNLSSINSEAFLAQQLGITSAIDNAIGIPGFTSFAINAAECSGGDAFSCYNAVLNVLGFMGFGRTTCDNPTTTAQAQIRTTLTQILNTDPVPTKIITFRPEDVYYFAGLNDQGEASQSLTDLLTEKYGPLADRGNSGMFTSPDMWNHIHVGY
jgi:hypothetical protein